MSKSELHDLEKREVEHVEHLEDLKSSGDELEHVADADAKGYIDHNIVIDNATNRRLRWLVHKRYVDKKPCCLFLPV
jgi:hypothetical protein